MRLSVRGNERCGERELQLLLDAAAVGRERRDGEVLVVDFGAAAVER